MFFHLKCGGEGSFLNTMDFQKANKWVLHQIKFEQSLEAKVIKLRMSYFGHIIKRLTGKDNNTRKRHQKKERLNMRWIDLSKEAMAIHLQDLSKAVQSRTFWRPLIHWVAINLEQHDGT